MFKTALTASISLAALVATAGAQEEGIAVPQAAIVVADASDAWMGQINWSLPLAEASRSGDRVIVGLVDTQLADPRVLGGDVLGTFGFVADSPLHGQAVATIIGASARDGRTVGVAPETDFIVANPFDRGFGATTEGIIGAIGGSAQLGASIVNLSLGQRGAALSESWQTILTDRELRKAAKDTLIVKAAGNDGIAQPYDLVIRNQSLYNQLLIVGSVDANNQISAFSNTPGTACVLRNERQRCTPRRWLANRFLVAPGEGILADAGLALGGFRVTGTSFATPLVTGTAALIHSKWPWLQRSPEATANIILNSATDLGARGIDPVYGHGLLNVEAALSPLDYRTVLRSRSRYARGASVPRGPLLGDGPFGPSAGMAGLFDPSATTPVIETVFGTHRDFEVSVASMGADERVGGLAAQEAQISGAFEPMGRAFAADNPTVRADAFASLTLADDGRTKLSVTASRAPADRLLADDALAYEVSYLSEDSVTGRTLAWGHGRGALYALAPVSAPTAGGAGTAADADPILALAAEGGFIGTSMPVAERLTFTMGATQASRQHYDQPLGYDAILGGVDGLADYSARAFTGGLSYDAPDGSRVGLRLALLSEDNGVLGGQGRDAFAIDDSAQTVALSAGYAVKALGIDFGATATVARTAQTAGNGLRVTDDLIATSFHLSASKRDLAIKGDGIRIAFSQPLPAEAGAFEHDVLAVVDRETGELGLERRSLDAGAARPLVAEAAYEFPAAGGRISAFGRAVSSERPGEDAIAGLRFSASF